MSAFYEETVTEVHHWTDTLFSFKTTRSPSFRFDSGHFTMIGLMVDGKPLVRAYSMAGPTYAEDLEFFSIKVQNGPLTSRLQHLKVGDTVLVGKKPTGTLLLDNLTPGRRIYFLSTGTGLAPFLSLIRDPAVYERFETVVVTHTCRTVAELAYADLITRQLPADEFLGEDVTAKLRYYPSVTREDFRTCGRITDIITSGRLAADLTLPDLNPAEDRVMLCGSPEMLADTCKLLEARGFTMGRASAPGDYVIEKAFVGVED
jgi:ferredoxin--NADP+ reductase